jgi:hypothetical protein
MPHPGTRSTPTALLVCALALLLGGCIVTRDSPAPGCVKRIGFPVIGGCAGKSAILDLSVGPASTCLDIRVNNCNGGVLEVDNSCAATLLLGGVEIPPAGRASLDIVDESGAYTLRRVDGNFSAYVPDQDRPVVITGTLDGLEIAVSLTKTARLCE